MQKLKSVRKLVATEQAARVTSFHLKLMLGSDFVLPDGQSSVDVLREPLKENSLARNLTNTCAEMWTKVCSISHQDHGNEIDFFPEWQQKLLLLTEKRIFMIGVDHSKSQQNGDAASDTLEIFNSISRRYRLSILCWASWDSKLELRERRNHCKLPSTAL